MLGESDLHIWQASLVPEANPALAAGAWLSADESRREARFLQAADRARFRLARSFLRLVLARYLHVDPQEVLFDYGPMGKPHLGGAFRASGIEFNLSHSADVMLLGITRHRPLGIDIERARPEMAVEAMADRFFAPGEVEHLFALEANQRRAAFFTIWSRKEAYIKARGTGLSAALDSFLVSTHPHNPPPVQVVAAPPTDPDWHLYPLNVPAGYFGAACTSCPALQVVYPDATELEK